MSQPPVLLLTATAAMGGTESHTIATAGALSNLGHRVTIAQLGHAHYEAQAELAGVALERLPPGRELAVADWRRLLGPPSTIVVQVKGGFGLIWPLLDRVVQADRGGLLRIEHLVPPPRTLRQRIVPREVLRLGRHRGAARRILTVAEPVRDALVHRYGYDPARIAVITNGVDADRFRPDPVQRLARRREWGIPDDRFVFGTVTRLAPIKRIDRMLRAFSRLDGGGAAPPHLVLAGEGPDAARLQALAGQLGIAARCHWLGPTSSPESVLPGFDAFLLSSETESASYALLEAMATELPVVAMAVGGVPLVMRDVEFGRLTATDVEAFAVAMAEVRAWPPARRVAAGSAARRHVQSHHDAARQARRVASWIASGGAAGTGS